MVHVAIPMGLLFDFFSLLFSERTIGILVLYLLERLYNVSQSKRDTDKLRNKWEFHFD